MTGIDGAWEERGSVTSVDGPKRTRYERPPYPFSR